MMEALEKETQEQIDALLPKIKRIDFSYTDYGALYKIRIYGEDKKELYIVNNPDNMFDWDRLDEDGVRYVANKLGIKTTDDFAAIAKEEGFYNLAYSELISPLIKAVQELSAEVDTLKTEKTKLQTDLTALTARVAALEAG